MPESVLEYAKQLIDEFEGQCRAHLKPKNKATSHPKIHAIASLPQMKRPTWTPEEDATLLKMKRDSCSWDDIHAAVPHRNKGTIQVYYYTKLKGSTRLD
jgi:hypothetical protein